MDYHFINAEMLAYIYLLQDGADQNTNIYKIGKTRQQSDSRIINRLRSYSKDTSVHNTFKVPVEHVDTIENTIKRYFKVKYRLVRGFEWFEGDVHDMRDDICDILKDFRGR
jgi:hypothetical protein